MDRTLHPRTTPRHAQRGQAMTEFVVGAVLFLVPVFLIIPMFGRYSDIKAAAAQSARYVAWERTVWYGGASAHATWPGHAKSEEELRREAMVRVVQQGRGVLRADDKTSGEVPARPRAMWTNRDGSTMLKTAAIGPVTNAKSPDIATGDVLGTLVDFTSFLGFSLETRGLYTGEGRITVTTLPIGGTLGSNSKFGLFDPDDVAGGPLVFKDRNVILANGWGANGASHVRSLVSGLSITGLSTKIHLDKIMEVAACAAAVAFVPELCFLDIGKIEPDIVPPDRTTAN